MSDTGNRNTSGRKGFALSGFVAGLVVACIALAGAGLFILYSGMFSVAATDEHMSITRWAFHTTMHHSVERRAASVAGPEKFTPEMVSAGAREYKEMCQQCHAGPGIERNDWSKGMRPKPPLLASETGHWNVKQIFWLAKNGVKMTGMPAFGPTHDDTTLWNIAAFVKELPGMTPQAYVAAGEEGEAAPATGGSDAGPAGSGATQGTTQ